MNQNIEKHKYKKTSLTLRHNPGVKVEEIEHVLNVFSEYIQNHQELDIAYTWKEGYHILDGDTYSFLPIVTGEDMCKRLLDYLESDFRYENDIDFEEEDLPSYLWPEYIQYVQTYLNQLPEYRHLLNPYRKNLNKEEEPSCVIYLNF